MEQDQQPSKAEQRMALAAKLKRAASLPRMKDGRRPPMHADAVSEGEKIHNVAEGLVDESNPQASDQVVAEVNGQAEVEAGVEESGARVDGEVENSTLVSEVEVEVEAAEVETAEVEAVEAVDEEEERELTTRTRRRSRSRARSRGSKDLRSKARAAQTPTPTFQSTGDSSQDEAPLRSPLNLAAVTPLMSPIPVASHFLELQRSRLLRSPTPISADSPVAFPNSPMSPIAPPTLEAWQKGLLRSNSAGGKAVGRNLAMQSLTGGTESYEPSGLSLTRNNTVTGTGERVAARQLMLSRLGGRIVKPDPGDVSIEERSGPSPTPRRRKRRSRRGSQSATTGVSDSEGVLSTSPSTPNAPSVPLPAFDDPFFRSRSITPFQSNSLGRDHEESPGLPLPNANAEVEQNGPPKRRSLVIEEDDGDEDDQYPASRPFHAPSSGTQAPLSRYPRTLGTPTNESSHSPSPARASPYLNQRTTPLTEALPSSPFATPLTELSSTQDDDEEVLYPPYRRADDFERELSWVAEPVPTYDSDPEKRIPIQESNDQEEDRPPLSSHSSNGFSAAEHNGYASPRASFSSRSLIVELETSPASPSHVSLAPLTPHRESVTHTSDESSSPLAYPKRLSVGLPSPDWGERNGDNPSTWEKVIGAFSRAGSSTGRRSRTNSIVNRNRADSVNRESGASLNSAKTDKVEAPTQQPPPLMQSPSASASISSLAAHARTAPSPVPPLTSANKSKYQHAKLFPFGMTTTQEERTRIPSASISTPDIRMSSNDEETPPLSAGLSQISTTPRERTLSHQTSDSHLVAKFSTSTPQAASPTNAPRSPSQNGTYKLPMTLPGVKQWLSKNKKKFTSTPSPPTSANEIQSLPSLNKSLAPDAAINHIHSDDWDESNTPPNQAGDLHHRNESRPIQSRSDATDTERTPKAKKTITIPPSEQSDNSISYFEASPLSPPSRPDPFSSATPDPSSSLSDYPAHSTSESSSTTSSQYSLGGPQGPIFLEKIDEELSRGSRSRIWGSIGDPPRKLLLATPVIQVVDQNTLKDRFLFLFNDILVITKPIFLNQEALADKDPSGRKFIIKSVVMLSQMRFAEGRTGTNAKDANGIKQRNRATGLFVNAFSKDPDAAISSLYTKSRRRDDPIAVGQLLFKTLDLDRVRLGEYLTKRVSKPVLKVFLDSFGFLGLRVDTALRVFLLSIHIPERASNGSNALEYLLEAFAGRWYEANAGHVDFNRDHTHRFVRAIVQLNDLLHGGISQEPGITKVPQRNISSDEFVEAFRRYDQKSSVSDGLLRDVYEAIVLERLSQCQSSNAHVETITVKRSIPSSLTWRVESDPIILRIPRADPDLTIELLGQDLIFEPQFLNFAKSPEVSFRVRSNVLGSRSIIMRRAGPNAVKYTGLPLSTPVLIERAVMRYTLQVAFENNNGSKRRYMFSVDDSLLCHQWAVHIRRQMEKVAQTSKSGLSKFRRAAETMAFLILQETLLGQSLTPLNGSLQKHSARGIYPLTLNGGSRAAGGSNGFQLASHHVRSKSRSKVYHQHGAGKNELDFNQPLRLRDEDEEKPDVERHEGRLWSAKELEMLCEQNSIIASLISDLQAVTSEQGES